MKNEMRVKELVQRRKKGESFIADKEIREISAILGELI